LDNLIASKAATLDADSLHLYPYYGEAYSEVLNIAAGLDFNFMFEWGPRLHAHERILIEVLVYLAREQARRAAFDAALRSGRQEVPVEIYIEKAPANNPIDLEGLPRATATLTSLTNLKRDRIYDALKSENVCRFVRQEPTRRIHVAGRVVTAPARFSVRVDPVPTPEQELQIRHLIASRSIEADLLTSPTATSLISEIATSVVSPTPTPLTSPPATPDHESLMSPKPVMSPGATPASPSSWCRSERHDSGILENPTKRNVSETAGGGPETADVKSRLVEEWRKASEDLARHSAKELSDERSLGYHILVWNHARKQDRLTGSQLTDGVFAILTDLAVRKVKSGQPQGRAWTRRTRLLFSESGAPLSLNAPAGSGPEAEEIRAILAASLLNAEHEADIPPAALSVPSELSPEMIALMDRKYEAMPDQLQRMLDREALHDVTAESPFFADAVAKGKRFKEIDKRVIDRRRGLLASGWADRHRE